MKKLSQYLKYKKTAQPAQIETDEKTIFYMFEKIIREEYGRRGSVAIRADYYKDGKIFVKTQSSNWASELWLSREFVINKINQQLGVKEIKEIKDIKVS